MSGVEDDVSELLVTRIESIVHLMAGCTYLPRLPTLGSVAGAIRWRIYLGFDFRGFRGWVY